MTDAALVGLQVRYEQRQFWRNPPSAFFAFAFPLVFLLLLSSIYRNNHVAQLGGINEDQYFVPAILAFGVFGATFTNLSVTLSIRRDSGVLKRLRSMPLPPWIYLAGVIGSAIITAMLLSAVTAAAGVAFFGVTWEGRWLGLLVDVAVGALAFSALGIALSSLTPSGDAATPITQFIVLPLSFISGNYGYIDSESWMTKVADVLPLKHFNRTVFAAFDPHGGGIGLEGRDLLIVAVWGLAGVLVSLRFFRWTPRD